MNLYIILFGHVWATLLRAPAGYCYKSRQPPSVRLTVDKIDERYNLFEYKEAVRNSNGQVETPSVSSQMSVGFTRSIISEIFVYWENTQNSAEISSDSLSSVGIQLKLNCGARYFTKWVFNLDDKIDSESKYLDMDYTVKFFSRDDENVLSDSFINNTDTEISELRINSFHAEFKSASIDCIHYSNASLKTRVYIFQQLDASKATFKDARGEYLKKVKGASIPCKVHNPEISPSLEFKREKGLPWLNKTEYFKYDWRYGFVPKSLEWPYSDNDDYRCILKNRQDVTHRFHSNPPVPESKMTKVAIKLAKSQSTKEWEFTCSVTDDQKPDDTFEFSLHSIRVESCDSPDYCHYNREHNTSRQNKICQDGEHESCTYVKPNFINDVKDKGNLDAEGKVTCFVGIDHKIYASHNYYFKGISGQFYLLSHSAQLPQDQILQMKLDRKEYSSDRFSCIAIKFLTFSSMKLSLTYRTGETYLLSYFSKPLSVNNGKNTFGIEKAEIQYAHNNVTSVNCHVPLFNSTQWRTALYTVKENIVGKHIQTQAAFKPTLEMTPSAPNAFPPSKPGAAPEPEPVPKPEPELRLRLKTFEDNSDPDFQTTTSTTSTTTSVIRATTTSTTGGKNPTRRPNGDSNQTQFVIFLSVMGVLFAGLFLFIACCVHRHFTCECVCCPSKPISTVKQECHRLTTLMKSERKKFSIPPSYLLSSKDIFLGKDLPLYYSQVVGHGQFSTVHQGYLKLSGKRSILVKSNKNAGNAIEIDALMNDVQMRILAGETNARITAVVGAYFDRTAGKVFIVMKTNTRKNLRELLTNENVPMSELTILNMPPNEMVQTFCIWLKGVSQGMEFLHSKKIVHGNLSAENILVCLKNTSSVSITGFSHSHQLIGNSSYFVKSRSWTTGWETSGWRWMPMESLRYMEFSKESDIWSFGVLMWEMFSLGQIPYLELGYFNLSMEFIQKLEFGKRLLQPQLAPNGIQMEACWSRCGKDRPMAIELCGYFSPGQSKLNNYV